MRAPTKAKLRADNAELVARLAELEGKVAEFVCPDCCAIIRIENDRPRTYLSDE